MRPRRRVSASESLACPSLLAVFTASPQCTSVSGIMSKSPLSTPHPCIARPASRQASPQLAPALTCPCCVRHLVMVIVIVIVRGTTVITIISNMVATPLKNVSLTRLWQQCHILPKRCCETRHIHAWCHFFKDQLRAFEFLLLLN